MQNSKNFLPEIPPDRKEKFKINSQSASIEWDQLINTSIPNSVKAQFQPGKANTSSTNKFIPTSDISYLRNTKRGCSKFSTSIYKEPELQQAKFDRTQGFYNTLYKKTLTKTSFNTTLQRDQGQLLDFTEILQENQGQQGLKGYFAEILKLSANVLTEREQLIPPNRQQAIDLRDWLFLMISIARDESAQLSTRDLAEKIQLIYATCLKELIKQVSIECQERGELMQLIWDFYIELINQILKCYHQQNLETEKQTLEQMNRIQQFHDSQMHQLQLKEQQRNQEMEKMRAQSEEAVSEATLAKAKMLALSTEIRQLMEKNEAQKKEIDSLLLQIILLKSQDGQGEQKQKVEEKIEMKFSKGQSIVSHLLNFQPMMMSDINQISRKRSSVFEKYESLRIQEQQIRTELVTQNVLSEIPDEKIFFEQAIQTMEGMINQVGTQTELPWPSVDPSLQKHALSAGKEQAPPETEARDSWRSIPSVELDRLASISEAKDLLSQLSIDVKIQQRLTEALEAAGDIFEKNQLMSERVINLQKQQTLNAVALMEKQNDIDTLQDTITQSVNDFVDILKRKKNQIKKLNQRKKQLSAKIQMITETYQIQITGISEEDIGDDDVGTVQEERDHIIDEEDEQNHMTHSQRFEDNDEIKQSQFSEGADESFNHRMQDSQHTGKLGTNQLQQGLTSRSSYQVQGRNNESRSRSPSQYRSDFDIDANRSSQHSSRHIRRSSQLGVSDQHSNKATGSIHQMRRNMNEQTSGIQAPNLQPQSTQQGPQQTDGRVPGSIKLLQDQGGDNQGLRNPQNTNQQGLQRKMIQKKPSYIQNMRGSRILEQNQLGRRIVTNDNDTEENEAEVYDPQNPQRDERVRAVVNQYKDQKLKHKRRLMSLQGILEQKQPKKYKRVYSQNTDVANNLLQDVMKKNKPKDKQFNNLQLQKLLNSILTDMSKQQEGYKIPFQVSIYDFFKNKYGFKQVAEKKIRQVYQYIYFENNLKTQLISKFCSMKTEMDEIGQKLLVSSYQFFSGKPEISFHKADILVGFDHLSEFLQEHTTLWLQPQQIQQIVQNYRSQIAPNQDPRKFYINYDELITRILDFYINNKKDQQSILEALFQAADLDGNNLIEYSEFKTLFRAIHPQQKEDLLQSFLTNADYQDENGDKMLTLSRFTEMSLEQGIFTKESVLRYGEGSESLRQCWESQKVEIKYRFLRANKYDKVKHTFDQMEKHLINNSEKMQRILWISYKLLNQESNRVIINYEAKKCLEDMLPPEFLLLRSAYLQIDQIE